MESSAVHCSLKMIPKQSNQQIVGCIYHACPSHLDSMRLWFGLVIVIFCSVFIPETKAQSATLPAPWIGVWWRGLTCNDEKWIHFMWIESKKYCFLSHQMDRPKKHANQAASRYCGVAIFRPSLSLLCSEHFATETQHPQPITLYPFITDDFSFILEKKKLFLRKGHWFCQLCATRHLDCSFLQKEGKEPPHFHPNHDKSLLFSITFFYV